MTVPPGLPPDQAIQAMMKQASEAAARAKVAGEEISALEVSVTSRNKAVTVTAGSGGILKSVRPGSAASNMTAVQICEAVMQAYASAARQAAEQASEIMGQALGRDTQAMRKMREALPPDPDADEEGDR
ncbi:MULTISPECIES: YbaB/EbfC family nucleoid-associated protein [unclassified Nocardioides]|uniref:YbaB/EbfC family nucleoid-associated protein n=1 Tax=unclassified Nocardioides TaxID=2615069 RepID=UPI0006F2A78E|nr:MULTISPECIES: YbaB/EbfC family nucleoid-associated protein [unclassified Nocardioides]KQY55489.1 hypothetical protein ASD30_16430 [Nocardioides sp. Root140]KQZ67159.1 hypothetical protein ASD66_19420 [Nocardioides sp. Root151]